VNRSKCILLALAVTGLLSAAGCSTSQTESEVKEPEITDPATITFDWQNAYENKLKDFMSSDKYLANKKGSIGQSMFEIRDLDGDDTPELIISPDTDLATPCEIYTYSASTLSPAGEIGNYGTFRYYPDIHILGNEYEGQGFMLGKFVNIEEGVLNEVMSYSDNTASASSGATIFHEINGEDVSRIEFDAALADFNNNFSFNAGRKCTFGEKSIHEAVRCAYGWGGALNDSQKELCRNLLTEANNNAVNANRNAAFEFCDLNADLIPELLISDGTEEGALCHIYYFSGEELIELEGSYGAYGQISFDIGCNVFYSVGATGTSYWSLGAESFSAADYKASDSIIDCGRLFELSEKNIEKALSAGSDGTDTETDEAE